MATFTTIPDTDLDANSPITENIMLALRDNALAIAEGDASAPSIKTKALSLTQSTVSTIILNSVGPDLTISTAILPKGIYYGQLTTTYTGAIEILINGGWDKLSGGGIGIYDPTLIISTGDNIRITITHYTSTRTSTLTYHNIL